jgi:glutamate/tyrosine decarboxylase-like PLP-dependent enzyme
MLDSSLARIEVEQADRQIEETFDPADWAEFSSLAHRALDDMVAYLKGVRDRPSFQEIPASTKNHLSEALPEKGIGLEQTYAEISEHILPYPTGNIHPRFWSWVGGTGTPQALLADLVISAMNSCNLGFDEAVPTYVELQLLGWLKKMFGLPQEASGLLVSGGSMANMVGLAVARNSMAGFDVRALGATPPDHPRMRFYASSQTHSSVRKAIELLGLGGESLVLIPVHDDYTINLDLLEAQIRDDRRAGFNPACIIANAGTVNTGALDPLDALADICRRDDLWLHVDGAFGAMASISRPHKHLVKGLERADSLAFDLHKWMFQQYDIGCALVRHRGAHQGTFEITPDYLTRFEKGVASGPTDFSAFGVQLSRSFRALRAWTTIKSEGLQKFRRLVDQNIDQAAYLTGRVQADDRLQLLAPTSLNVVNFRYRGAGHEDEVLNALNKELLMLLQTRGIASPSSTQLNGRFSIRVAITNHRSRRSDFDALIDGVLRIGTELESR